MENYDELVKAGIDMDALLRRLMGNSTLVRVFIRKFTEDPTMENLRAAFAAKDEKAAEMASHTLKGMCGNLSLTELFTLVTEQVKLLRDGEYAKAESMQAPVEQAYRTALEHMNTWLQPL